MAGFDDIDTPYIETKAIIVALAEDYDRLDELVATMDADQLDSFQEACVDSLVAIRNARRNL